MGAEYAVGFLYGAQVGGFDDNDLYQCLRNEPDADDLFLDSDGKLKKAMNDNNSDLAVEALTEMIAFVIDMALEQDDDGNLKCPVFYSVQEDDLTDIRQMIEILNDPDFTLQYLEEGIWLYNNADISTDI